MSKIKETVSWIMEDEPLLKLKISDKTYDIDEKVFKYITDNKLYEKEDFEVEVEIDKNQGENGTITSLKEVGGTEPLKESKETDTSDPQSEDLVVKELTVGGVSVAKKGVIFKEENKVWYTLDDSIDVQEFKDKYTKRVVEVSVRQTDKGNDVIVSFTAKEEEKTNTKDEEQKIQEPKKNNGNMVQKSIEAQASINSANRVAQAMVNSDSNPDDVTKIIRKVAEFNFDLIQEFKNKE